MESSKIDELLEKFWAGETSDEQEEILRNYFCSGNTIEKRYQDAAAYFISLKSEKERLCLPADFELELMNKIQGGGSSRFLPGSFYRMAASIALVIGVAAAMFYWFNEESAQPIATQEYGDTYEDPRQAYEEVKRALMMVSTSMNAGVNYSKKLGKEKEKAGETPLRQDTIITQ